ncbi:MAG: HEAT repeat domain-containing protein, partial [Anaerolineales bacterium]|nr:HEAT repeat domain-containing protein [Anaerolineales bacterium]
LGEIKDARAVEPLVAALGDAEAGMRRWAAWALGEIKDARAVEPLVAALDDADEDVRWSAALALGNIGDPRALPALERVAREDKGETESGSVAEAAREAAGEIRRRLKSAEQE